MKIMVGRLEVASVVDLPSSTRSAREEAQKIFARLVRHAGEIKAYIDLFFLALVILLCIAKIVTN